MPEYSFSNHKKPKEIVTIFMGMNDAHEYIVDGIKWNREWSIPRAAIDTKCDPFSEKDYIRNTANKKGPVSDLWDRSKEASIKREQMAGIDETKIKYLADQKKIRNGKPCGAEIEANANKVIKV